MRNEKDLPLMFAGLARKMFGSANERQIKAYRPRVDEINALEKELEALSDEALRARTVEFRQQLAGGKTLDDVLVPAFATVREAAKRTIGQRHFDVQLIGGMILHEGKIAEMKTGEGKTLVATLAVYLNAISGRGVHVVTVNDYLARRDAEWMGQIYKFLGLTVGVIVHGLDDEQRKQSYDGENVSTVHHVNQALRAHKLFHRDKDYIVRNGEVVIIDEFTGRMMPGRRYSEGLHQALEAKEHQPIQPENQTLASITFQNYFRMYNKLSGMTGTALTEADEFMDIYKLEVLEVPTNKPLVRIDDDDEVYRTTVEKYRSIITLIEDCKKRGQPV